MSVVTERLKPGFDCKKSFFDACERSRHIERSGGIGTMREKSLHAAVKLFIEPDVEKHEKRIGRYIADIKNMEGIFEIQTRAFNTLRKKLAVFLPKDTVTVVYPIPASKRIIWIDKATGAMSRPRKSPKHGSYMDAFFELYKLGELVSHENLRLLILLIDIEEYRLLDGRGNGGKKGSTRFERIPIELESAILLKTATDYADILPCTLPAQFTSKELAKYANIGLSHAQKALLVLTRLNAVRCIGKQGRLKLYSIPARSAVNPENINETDAGCGKSGKDQ